MAANTDERARDDLEAAGLEMVHELKNPLAGVKALVQLGLRNPAEAASHARLATVERELGRMEEILRRYVSGARSLAEATAGVRLGRLASGVLRALSARAEEAGVRLSAQGDATVEGDPRRLEEALVNLVANGIEATPPGGEVRVDVGPAGGGHVEIVVRDTGCGIPAEALRRVGTPFFTTRAEGSGLGVALARSAIALHGGTLRYESEPGKGTTARAVLPARARAA